MKDRSAGKIDAYGNTILTGGNDRNDNQPTTILTTQAQTAKKNVVSWYSKYFTGQY